MDISKQPINSSANTSQRPTTPSSQTVVITDINELKLEAGKVYSATVIQAKEINSPNTEASLKTQAKTQAGQAIPEPKQEALAKNEWLLLLKGKVILISSEKPLEIGQKLLLKLETSAPGEKPTLLAQVVNNKAKPLSNKSDLSDIIQTINSANTRPLTGTQPSLIDNTNIKLLLQALNLTLNKQTPLKQGFDQLSSILKPSSTTIIQKGNDQILQSVKTLLLDTLPKLTDFAKARSDVSAPINTFSPASTASSPLNASVNFIKNSMLNSGIFLEKTLFTEPHKLLAFKEQLASLESFVSKNPPQIATSTQNTQPAISKVQQTIESLLQLAANQTSKTPQQKTLDATSAQFNDLKASLISTAALLSKQLAAELSATELKNIFLGASANDTIISPFAFPIVSSASINSSKALFAKQEFSTGQLLKILAGMIHKLQFNQLNSLLQSNSNTDAPLQQTWFFELPILNPNQTVQTFNFRMDKEPQHDSEEQGSTTDKEFKWKLLLSFDLDSLGPIYIQIALSKNSISSVLWANKDSTFALLEKESVHFKSQLEKIGLKVDEMHCKKGQPNQIQTKLDRHLVDTKA
tara:strand:+ start:10140 stop:11882 length:1743 start_codon:yes stop_codon:yes gene_type:complete